jgi:putative transposase
VREVDGLADVQIWQRNYYEQIIRNERMLNALREYITANPENWLSDDENPGNGFIKGHSRRG